MNKKTCYSFIKSHNLVNRVYDMLNFYKLFDGKNETKEYIKDKLNTNLYDIYYVESLSKYFEDRRKITKNNITLKYNLLDLTTDLDYLKQYLNK